jgi:hypothetical protein
MLKILFYFKMVILVFLYSFQLLFCQNINLKNYSKTTFSEDVSNVKLMIYQDSGFKGQNKIFKSTKKIESLDDWNDEISSFQIQDGYSVTMFEHEKFKGKNVTINRNISNLKKLNINDKVSSLIIEKESNKIIGFIYDNTNFSGNFFPLRHEDLSNLNNHTWLNDKISSIQLDPGNYLKIFEGSNYTGKSLLILESIKNLKPVNWNDKISSIKAFSDEKYQMVGSLYPDGDFKGSYLPLYIENNGFGEYKNLDDVSWINDKSSSVKIKEGYEILFFKNSNYKGKYKKISKDSKSLKKLGLNDNISSFRIMKEGIDISFFGTNFGEKELYFLENLNRINEIGLIGEVLTNKLQEIEKSILKELNISHKDHLIVPRTERIYDGFKSPQHEDRYNVIVASGADDFTLQSAGSQLKKQKTVIKYDYKIISRTINVFNEVFTLKPGKKGLRGYTIAQFVRNNSFYEKNYPNYFNHYSINNSKRDGNNSKSDVYDIIDLANTLDGSFGKMIKKYDKKFNLHASIVEIKLLTETQFEASVDFSGEKDFAFRYFDKLEPGINKIKGSYKIPNVSLLNIFKIYVGEDLTEFNFSKSEMRRLFDDNDIKIKAEYINADKKLLTGFAKDENTRKLLLELGLDAKALVTKEFKSSDIDKIIEKYAIQIINAINQNISDDKYLVMKDNVK